MYFAYFDESGDSGYTNSPTPAFTLSCVLVHDRAWIDTLDALVNFRRFLKKYFGLRMHDEVKANYLVHNRGDLKRLSLAPAIRMRIYTQFMRLQVKTGIQTFGVVIAKDKPKKATDPRDMAWHWAIQRLERFGSNTRENVHILPDAGHGDFIRKKLRAMRRFSQVPSAFVPGVSLPRPARNIVEDPSDRRSHESYFIQVADLNAYAAYRHIRPVASFSGSMWDELKTARVLAVNAVRGGPPGIVSWP